MVPAHCRLVAAAPAALRLKAHLPLAQQQTSSYWAQKPSTLLGLLLGAAPRCLAQAGTGPKPSSAAAAASGRWGSGTGATAANVYGSVTPVFLVRELIYYVYFLPNFACYYVSYLLIM